MRDTQEHLREVGGLQRTIQKIKIKARGLDHSPRPEAKETKDQPATGAISGLTFQSPTKAKAELKLNPSAAYFVPPGVMASLVATEREKKNESSSSWGQPPRVVDKEEAGVGEGEGIGPSSTSRCSIPSSPSPSSPRCHSPTSSPSSSSSPAARTSRSRSPPERLDVARAVVEGLARQQRQQQQEKQLKEREEPPLDQIGTSYGSRGSRSSLTMGLATGDMPEMQGGGGGAELGSEIRRRYPQQHQHQHQHQHGPCPDTGRQSSYPVSIGTASVTMSERSLSELESTDAATATVVTGKFTLADFDILCVLGRGAFGKVFQVRNRIDGKIYAMKVMRKDVVFEKDHVHYITAERTIMTQVSRRSDDEPPGSH